MANKKTEQPQDVRIEDYSDYVECYCRFKNRKIAVFYIKSKNTFQTMVKAYFGKSEEGKFFETSNERNIQKINYDLTKESFTCLVIMQNELLNYLIHKTDYLK